VRRAVVLLLLVGLLAGAAPAAAADFGTPPWQRAETLRRALFAAQTELILGDGATARARIVAARRAYAGALRSGVRSAAPAADAAVRAALRGAASAVRGGDQRALAAARGTARGAIFAGGEAATLAAVRRGDAAAARSWLLLREFRTATRLTRPGADGTLAVRAAGAPGA
jgi:high-affinity iron transporter